MIVINTIFLYSLIIQVLSKYSVNTSIMELNPKLFRINKTNYIVFSQQFRNL